MGMFNINYISLLAISTVIGVVLSLLTPSISVRVVIITPIILSCLEVCELPVGSKERFLVLLTAWAMTAIPGTAWQSGSLTGPILTSFYGAIPELPAIDFMTWLKICFPPIMLISLLLVIGGYFVFKPQIPLSMDKTIFKGQYIDLGPASLQEKATLVTLVLSFMFFLTSGIHKIADSAICLIGLFILAVFQILSVREISTGLNWDLVIFMGAAMGFSQILTTTGIAGLLSDRIAVLIQPIASNSWLLVYVVLIVFFAWRLVDIASLVPTMAIVSSVSLELSKIYGINPFLWIPLLSLGLNSFFLSYSSVFVLAAEANLGERGWTPGT